MKQTRERSRSGWRLLLASASGCGYALAGRGNSLPDYIKIIGIPNFVNQSQTPDLDTVAHRRGEAGVPGARALSHRVADIDAASTRCSPSRSSRSSSTPTEFNPARQASKYAMTVIASVGQFTDEHEKKVFWANPALRALDEVLSSSRIRQRAPTRSVLFSSRQERARAPGPQFRPEPGHVDPRSVLGPRARPRSRRIFEAQLASRQLAPVLPARRRRRPRASSRSWTRSKPPSTRPTGRLRSIAFYAAEAGGVAGGHRGGRADFSDAGRSSHCHRDARRADPETEARVEGRGGRHRRRGR